MLRYAVIRCAWDDDAKVWYVQETDVPGLATEAPTLDALREKVPALIRDLLADDADRPEAIEIDLIAHAHHRVPMAA